jgi:tRNA-Thr(GGU) m(6)t(6)A37 methyltransferase TsaA
MVKPQGGVKVFGNTKIEMRVIGYVKTQAIGREVKDRHRISQIVVHEDRQESLAGINDFSHIFVLFWMHGIPEEKREVRMVHPRGRLDMPLLGVFATRTPFRPNPIGLTLVELLKLDDNVLTVRGLDAYNGTPVLDLKPFDQWDAAIDFQVPSWWLTLEREKIGNNSD